MRRFKPALLCSLILLGFVAWRGWRKPPNAPVATLIIEAQGQQTIKGWGIYPCTFEINRATPDLYTIFNRANAQRLILKELGVSFVRANILPRSYDTKRDALDIRYLDATLVRQLKLARRFGHSKYLLTVWSPPAAWKNPPVTFGQDRSGKPSKLRPDREADYCRFVVRVLDFLTKQRGLSAPIAYSIQNEPSYAAAQWDGTAYDALQWRRVLVRMRRVLDSGGYKRVPLVGPECGDYARSVEFVGGPNLSALQNPAFKAAMAGFAYHGYTLYSRHAPYPQQLRQAAQTAHASGKDVWMTEWSIAQKRTPLEHALEVTQRLGRETAYIPTNYWTWWQGWYYRHPKGEVLLTGKDDKHLHISKTYYVLQKLWHSAPSGSIVHRVQSNDPDIKGFDPDEVQAVAFVHPRRTTLLLINPTPSAKTLHIKGLSGTKASLFLTTETLDMKDQGARAVKAGATLIQLPPRCIALLTTETK